MTLTRDYYYSNTDFTRGRKVSKDTSSSEWYDWLID